MAELGHCGGPVPNNGRLPVLVGPWVGNCITHGFLTDPQVQFFAGLVDGPNGPGPLSNADPLTLTPMMRDALAQSRGWADEYRAKRAAEQRAQRPEFLPVYMRNGAP